MPLFDVLEYIHSTPILKAYFGMEPLQIKEIGDGNLNFIFRVGTPYKSLIIKYAPPYLRLLGKNFKLPQERVCVEMHTMSYFKSIAPEYLPTIYHLDEKAFLFAMEDLEGFETLQKMRLDKNISTEVYEKLGDFLKKVYTHTPPLHARDYYENATLKQISENYIFRFPHIANHEALCVPEFFKPLPKDEAFLEGIKALTHLFLYANETLIHGDLHTGSVMIKENTIAIIDAEFSFFGPVGFDMGNLFAHILFGEIYALLEGKIVDWEEAIRTLWQGFGGNEKILQSSVGFCGAELFRRLLVPSKAKPLEAITQQKHKEKAYHLVDALCIDLVSNYTHITHIEDFLTRLKRYL
ncbi:MAG: phosphotransferase [Sulfurospirillaceae bacterium]|nr:phosphotransferase [Sulfurospirillaceae bacterium]MDD2826583.1 phosphotransferase [Sulfurospirillaceae bacterium]